MSDLEHVEALLGRAGLCHCGAPLPPRSRNNVERKHCSIQCHNNYWNPIFSAQRREERKRRKKNAVTRSILAGLGRG